MARYLCQLCFSIVAYDDNHSCFFYKNDDNVYSLPRTENSDEKHDEAKDKSTENASFTATSEKVESRCRPENAQIKTYEKTKTVTGSNCVDIQRQRVSGISDLIYAATEEECKMPFRENKWQTLNKDKNNFVESLECVIRNVHSENNNISRTAKLIVNPDLSPRCREPKNDKIHVPRGETDENISLELHSQGHNNNKKMATYMQDPIPTKENNNAVADPSGMCPGRKTFPCSLCLKEFNARQSLNRHYLTHTGEKPFVCDVCNKGFAHKGNLNAHIRTHTGEKPYKCPTCERSFRNSNHCKKHHKRKHL